jgi:glycerate kinase
VRVVVAPDKFKGSLDAAGVAAALAAGIRDVVPDAICDLIPMADGGDGTVDAFVASGASAITVRVSGPLGAPVNATYARDRDAAVVEMAAASGLALLGDGLDARRATTRGTGELLRDALDHGATRIVLGIGGSATTDGGAGALAALGARFLDAAGTALEPIPEALARVARIDLSGLDARLREVDLAIACDVDNPLLGKNGAAAVYGPQKGASPDDVAFLDGVLSRLADAMTAATGRDLRDLPGAGAAGGLGWVLASACGARLERGVVLVAELRGLAAALRGADWCFTGEGRIDEQTLRGKVVAGVAALARAAAVPVFAFGGSVELAVEPALRARGVCCVPIVPGPLTLQEAIANAAANLRAAAARVTASLTSAGASPGG